MLLDLVDAITAGLTGIGIPKFLRWIGLVGAANWLMGKDRKGSQQSS